MWSAGDHDLHRWTPLLRQHRAGKPNGWLVQPDDVNALTNALVEAVNDDAARKERADHARQQIRGAFSWRALAARFDALYTDVLDRAS